MDNYDNEVTVRWFDGYIETFTNVRVRFGCDLVWVEWTSGKNRHIPVRQVRWYSIEKSKS